MNLKQKLKLTRIEEIKCYRFFGEDGRMDRLDFIPVENMPGFSHRVAYNGILTHTYFGKDFTLCQRNALDILDILREKELDT